MSKAYLGWPVSSTSWCSQGAIDCPGLWEVTWAAAGIASFSFSSVHLCALSTLWLRSLCQCSQCTTRQGTSSTSSNFNCFPLNFTAQEERQPASLEPGGFIYRSNAQRVWWCQIWRRRIGLRCPGRDGARDHVSPAQLQTFWDSGSHHEKVLTFSSLHFTTAQPWWDLLKITRTVAIFAIQAATGTGARDGQSCRETHVAASRCIFHPELKNWAGSSLEGENHVVSWLNGARE